MGTNKTSAPDPNQLTRRGPWSVEELEKGHKDHLEKVRRDAIYTTATFLVAHFRNEPSKVAEGLGVLLLVWNQACYRHGPFDYSALEECLKRNRENLNKYQKRDILSYSAEKDGSPIKVLFQDFLEALQICDGKCKGRRTPVGAVKALHLLAPGFFPLWDARIAKWYGCSYASDPTASYLKFMQIVRTNVEHLKPNCDMKTREILKQIDEFNWIHKPG